MDQPDDFGRTETDVRDSILVEFTDADMTGAIQPDPPPGHPDDGGGVPARVPGPTKPKPGCGAVALPVPPTPDR